MHITVNFIIFLGLCLKDELVCLYHIFRRRAIWEKQGGKDSQPDRQTFGYYIYIKVKGKVIPIQAVEALRVARG
jgi:hypothetical protein